LSTPAHASLDERLLGSQIARTAGSATQRRALTFGDEHWSYGEFDQAIRVTAAGLAAAQLNRGDRVLLAGTARPEALFTLFALARLGAVAVPVQPSLTEREIGALSATVAPVATVGDANFLRRTPAGGLRLSWDTDVPDAKTLRPDADVRPFDGWHSAPEDPAILAFTSGTSGRPKGVILAHENLFWGTRNALQRLDIDQDDRVLVSTPLAHTAVFSGLAQHAWTTGGSVVLAPRFDPDLFIDAVHEHRVTTAFAVAAMLGRLVRSPRWTTISDSALRWLLVGGGPPVKSLTLSLARAGITVINSYGLTEASGGVTYARPDEVAHHPLSAGRPAAHVELRIANADGAPTPPGVTGEIWLRGPSVAREYLLPDGAHTPAVDQDGWLHTGDRGLQDLEGRLFVSGRIADTIVTGGENVDPSEVEDALSAMAEVRDVAVIGLPDPVWGETVAAVLVLEPGASVRLEDLRTHLRPRLARHKIPRRLILVDALPRTPTGKLQRHALISAVRDPPIDAKDAENP